MATKLSKEMTAKLKKIGIVAKTGTEEEARKLLTALLKKDDVPVKASETLEEIYDMAEALYEGNDDAPDEEEEEEEVVKPKKGAAKKKVVEEEDEDEDEATDEDEEEEEEEEVKPKKGAKATAKKEVKTKKAKTAVVRGVRFDPLNNDAHDALLEPLRKVFKGKDYEVRPLQNGVSVFILAKANPIIIFSLKNGVVVNGDVQGVLWNNRFKASAVKAFNKIVPEDFFGDDVKVSVHGSDPLVTIRRITVKQWVKMMKETDLLATNMEEVTALDKKMGKNREKLESTLKQGKGKDAKPATKKKVVVVEEEEEEEEEVVKPKKKIVPAKKSAPVKKAVKKK